MGQKPCGGVPPPGWGNPCPFHGQGVVAPPAALLLCYQHSFSVWLPLVYFLDTQNGNLYFYYYFKSSNRYNAATVGTGALDAGLSLSLYSVKMT